MPSLVLAWWGELIGEVFWVVFFRAFGQNRRMGGDGMDRSDLDALYAKEGRVVRRKIFWIQVVAVGLCLSGVVLVLSVDRSPLRYALLFSMAISGWMGAMDRDWLVQRQKFSIGLILVVLGAAILRLALAMVVSLES